MFEDEVGEVFADAGGVEVACVAGGGGAELLADVGRTPDTLFICMAFASIPGT